MKICTWNSRGNKFQDCCISTFLTENNIDILCIQECGNIDYLTEKTWRLYKRGNYQANRTPYHLIYYPWNWGGRCNLAMLVKAEIEIKDIYVNKAQLLYDAQGNELNGYQWGNPHIRNMLTAELKYNGMEFTVNNVHLPSGCPAFARKVGYRLFCNYFSRSRSNVFTLGDFNTTPDTWILQRPFSISAPNHNTHTGGKILDYMITNDYKQYNATIYNDNFDSDHYPVWFDI